MSHETFIEKVLERETLYLGSYLNLEKIRIELPDGRQGTREIVRVKDAVAILPVDSDGFAHLILQHRPAIQKTILEIPAGVMDHGAESAEACARRECQEETGIIPKRVIPLLRYAHAEGYSTGFITLFLGLDLIQTHQTRFDSSEYIEQVKMPFSELVNRVQKNEFLDSKTILATLLSKPHLL